MTESHTTISEIMNLEFPLKTLLENMLSFLEKIVTNQDEIVLIEGKLHDYETINELTDILLDVWSFFSVKLTERLDSTPQASEISLQEYKKLEESLQKHEGQIRNHIAVEQQLRLCAETFQNKVEELEKEKEKESFLNKEATETLKTQLYESQTVVNNMKKTIEIYQKTISKQEKSLEEMKKKMFQGSISDERKVLGLSYQNREEDGLSPTLRNKNMKKNNDGLGNLHDYLRIRNVKKIKSISQHKFEETPIPAKAFSELSNIYGNSMKNLFKPKNTKLNYTSSHIPLQNHIINMNFPKNPLIFKNSGPKSNKQNLLSNSHLNINVTNLTNSLIVNQNPNFNHNNIINNLNNNINNSIAPQIKNSKPTRRSKSQTNFNKISVKEISMQQKD